jgi:hypothetical protein
MPGTDELIGIDTARHQRLEGRDRYAWGRRAGLILAAVLPVLALIGVFGQRAVVNQSSTPAASLEVKSPDTLRGGLVFTTQIVITPHRDLHDGILYMQRGWFANMTLNGITPQPTNQDAQGEWQIWDFGPMQSGQPFRVWISWQVNPTNVGGHRQDVQLYDGQTLLTTTRHDLTVFP